MFRHPLQVENGGRHGPRRHKFSELQAYSIDEHGELRATCNAARNDSNPPLVVV
jgi:hypothetical protein